jgi:hypothetical protein
MEHSYAASNFDLFENIAFLGYYAASGGNFLPTFRDNLSVKGQKIKQLFECKTRKKAFSNQKSFLDS